MDNVTVYIPNNFTDAGKIFGMFEMRNVAEALIVCVPLILLTVILSPFGLTGTLITGMIIVVSLGGFALMGIQDYSLFTFARIHRKWRKNRRILTYRGSKWIINTRNKKKKAD